MGIAGAIVRAYPCRYCCVFLVIPVLGLRLISQQPFHFANGVFYGGVRNLDTYGIVRNFCVLAVRAILPLDLPTFTPALPQFVPGEFEEVVTFLAVDNLH